MKNIFFLFFILISISTYSSENKVISAHEIKLNKFNLNIIDENENMIKLYDKVALRIINPDYSELFSFDKKARKMFNEFIAYLHNADILLNLGISFSIIGPVFISITFMPAFYSLIIGFGFFGSLILCTIGCMIAYGVFMHMAHKKIKKLIKYYNDNNSEMLKSDVISKIEFNLVSVKF